ncbi:protein adenylyltransferase SelO [Thiomicrorhabdus aquaedulcis]|uniref:protein adenylyltransferase SelO n=1 Tax=Thiomicrorhabdus aquaedulcis TaxID=2211106 RepID=UPI000FDAA3EE|nr:YdiU family protein [Thiomicrorhabdus aquaedulcis]
MTQFYNAYLNLPNHFYRAVKPQPMLEADLVHCNQPLAHQLGLNFSAQQWLDITCGVAFPDGWTPIAQKYTGHQFGYYNPQLGDGRGVLLGQVNDAHDQAWDVHLKGSGQTPFSRQGDGRAVLRSAVREYLIGEALHALGVPTTRCLALCHGLENVRRDGLEPRATYLRVAKTHIRFGHFEWLAQQNDVVSFKALANYVIQTVYPDLATLPEPERYAQLLNTIVSRTAQMIALWQKVGFCHGVMNTDNMSVAGETFDFGPYAFLDDCQLHYVCNHSDTQGRYAYSQQPSMGLWNCQVLISAFAHVISEADAQHAAELYINTYNQAYLSGLCAKLGLANSLPQDKHFVADTLILLEQSSLDFHVFFNKLVYFNVEQRHCQSNPFTEFVGDSQAWQQWATRYQARLALEHANQEAAQNNLLHTALNPTQFETQRVALINTNTPQLVLRNYIAQEIIEAAQRKDYAPLTQWVHALREPFSVCDALKAYSAPPSQKGQKGLALSCSS